MSRYLSIGRSGLVLLLPIFFGACSCCREWELTHSKSTCPSYSATRLLLPASDEYRGLQFHVDCGEFGTRVLVSSLHRQFPCYRGDSHSALLKVEIEEEVRHFVVERMEGGQQLLLPCVAGNEILASLQSDQTVIISVGGHKETLEASNFSLFKGNWPIQNENPGRPCCMNHHRAGESGEEI